MKLDECFAAPLPPECCLLIKQPLVFAAQHPYCLPAKVGVRAGKHFSTDPLPGLRAFPVKPRQLTQPLLLAVLMLLPFWLTASLGEGSCFGVGGG